MKDRRVRGFRAERRRREIVYVGNALFLVDDQIEDEIEIFRVRLFRQLFRRHAINAAIIHVDMNVAAAPTVKRFSIGQQLQGDRFNRCLSAYNVGCNRRSCIANAAPDGDFH